MLWDKHCSHLRLFRHGKANGGGIEVTDFRILESGVPDGLTLALGPLDSAVYKSVLGGLSAPWPAGPLTVIGDLPRHLMSMTMTRWWVHAASCLCFARRPTGCAEPSTMVPSLIPPVCPVDHTSPPLLQLGSLEYLPVLGLNGDQILPELSLS